MAVLQPLYTAENIKVAYQLNWSLSVFWRQPPCTSDWLEPLGRVAEADGVRILEHRFATPTCSLFLVSTRPELVPQQIPRVIKGRLQYLVRDRWPKAFQRNYDLRSLGSTQRDKIEAYVASQLEHHHADERVLHERFADLQFSDPEVDLGQPRFAEHARYWCNLHLVLVHDWRRSDSRPETWLRVRHILRTSATSKGWLLSRLGIVPDHLHVTLGFPPATAPLDVALSCMNNVAYVHAMQPVLMASCFMATFGEYDLGAIKR